ncbi:hypothetical protein [Streptomyces sp. t39]|uniref:hypothetical protein n=1 Tax=Streptomyces sp. t39 TaxID=1828156 RepID=UPI0011CDB9DD|nr:hypothetical protein [Streptomyces sp. t39]TXS50147.1 hypothetical protein EAO77_27955 [Streptomyces sp. t39]
MTVLLAVTAALFGGYVLGRYRPWTRLGDWAEWRLRADGQWWITSTRRELLVATIFVITWPRSAWNAWQLRNSPSAPAPEVPRLDPNWATNRTDKEA